MVATNSRKSIEPEPTGNTDLAQSQLLSDARNLKGQLRPLLVLPQWLRRLQITEPPSVPLGKDLITSQRSN